MSFRVFFDSCLIVWRHLLAIFNVFVIIGLMQWLMIVNFVAGCGDLVYFEILFV